MLAAVVTLSELEIVGRNTCSGFGGDSATPDSFTASVDYGIMAITVTAEPTDEDATRKIMVGDGDDAVVYEDGAVPLEVGDTAIVVEVTAENGMAMATYTVTVTRAGAPIDDGVEVEFTATIPEDLPKTLPTGDEDPLDQVTFALGVTTGEHAITAD